MLESPVHESSYVPNNVSDREGDIVGYEQDTC
jgi:hypothetical protein